MYADQDRVLHLVTKGGLLSSLSVTDGSRLSIVALNDPSTESDDAGFRRIFTSAAFSLELNMVAVVQRGRPISLYDMEEGTFLGSCEREADTELERTDFALLWVCDFIFNPDPDASLLAALYHDGDLLIFDPCELAVKTQLQTDAQILACSPDGRILATGNDTGTIQIFEFGSLSLMYKVIASDYSIKSLAFSSDGLRFLDIRGNQCNVWLVHHTAKVGSGGIGSYELLRAPWGWYECGPFCYTRISLVASASFIAVENTS
jgi:WD40 repeat protein